MKKTRALYLFMLLAMPSQALAAWLEVTGQAQVLESDKAARNNALEDAVYQASYIQVPMRAHFHTYAPI